MLPWKVIWPKSAQYQPLTADEEEWTGSPSSDEKQSNNPCSRGQTLCACLRLQYSWLIAVLITILAVLSVFSVAIATYVAHQSRASQELQSASNDTLISDPPVTEAPSQPRCPQRREWRTLARASQEAYIKAVHCLLEKPSKLSGWLKVDGISAYSDFPYIHAHVGYRTHNSAPFSPWHRYLLHIYETALREQCGYTGSLVYWDWTLDVDDLARSPVLDPDTGFGGDGDPTGEVTVGRHGRCLRDGPFQDVQALWYDVKYQPHCLSRGFRNDDGVGTMDTSQITPEKIDEIMQLQDYELFVKRLESQVHDTIPFGIGGDFETFSAPFDPLFYLHHVQLDRLWWLWQQSNSQSNLFAYGGHNGRHTIEVGKLTDEISMGGLAPAIKVEDVMDTSGNDNMLCYSY